jgi:phospholipid/cholesterol/gamma-HCH transport system permease protein
VSAREPTKSASVEATLQEQVLTLRVSGWLDAHTVGGVWEKSREAILRQKPSRVVVDAAQINYCDGAGIAMLVDLRRPCGQQTVPVEVRGLAGEYQPLLDLFEPSDFAEIRPARPEPVHLPQQVGEAAVNLWKDLAGLVGFVGELAAALGAAALHPRNVRWRDALLAAENAGVNALPIVALISFLIGLIMAFQSAIPMRQFGAEIYVADLVALSMLRELGPLMTAIILAGRSGSAFAAEIGTMKVNEEIDALTTMGLDPVRFLVITRVIAAVLMMPLLTLFSNLMGLVGGAIVFLSFDFPLVTYYHEVLSAVHLKDLNSGLAKSFVFGILVSAIGCLRGLQTRTGASAVGLSATRAVVSGIVLIVLADGVFSVVFYYLGI